MVHGNFMPVLMLMALAVSLVWLFRRLGLPPIVAYLCCGLVGGPELLGLVENDHQIQLFAEFGIVFLLFSLGLEFSLPRLLAMRHWVFGLGLCQVVLSIVFFMALSMGAGLSGTSAFVVASMAALSSTAVVIKQMAEYGTLREKRSQLAVSVLLFQDLAVVPVLIVIPLLAATTDQSLPWAISIAIVKGTLVVAILLAVGKWLLPRLFSEVAATRSDELFMLTTLLVTFLAAGLTYYFGLSMALGAFLAGMMLGESQYRHQLESDIRPFRDILLGLFFVTIGMRLELSVLQAQWYWVILGLGVLLVAKVLIVRLSAWLVKVPKEDAWAAGIKLAQMGEFSFVIAALATKHTLLDAQQSSLLLATGLISMALTPYLVKQSKPWAKAISGRRSQPEPDNSTVNPGNQQPQVLILGFGRVGQSASRLLRMEAIPYVAIDGDPVRVQEARNAGEHVLYGNAARTDILKSAGVDGAKIALITFDQHTSALSVIEAIKSLRADLPIVVRTRKDHHLEELYAAGASQVVPEILEGSLMLVSQVMHLSGVPISRIFKRVRKERKAHYQHLHGFFPGESTDLHQDTEQKLEFMHAVILGPDAFAVGQALSELQLGRLRVELHGLRRDKQEITDPGQHEVLKAGDVMVISGKPRRVERAERYLLEGD